MLKKVRWEGRENCLVEAGRKGVGEKWRWWGSKKGRVVEGKFVQNDSVGVGWWPRKLLVPTPYRPTLQLCYHTYSN